MEILSGESNASVDFLAPTNKDSLKVGLFDMIGKIFFLNKEERFRAGIFIGHEGREWIDQAGTHILPTFDGE